MAMPEMVIIGWDWKDQPDISELHRAVCDISGGKVHIREVESGTDDYTIVVSDAELDDEQAQAAYRAWEVAE
jgi:hypothetical protein